MTFIELLQPYITAIMSGAGALVLAAIAAVVTKLRGKIGAWIDAKTTESQRGILHSLAVEAAALAESAYIEGGGPAKLNAAVDYVNKHVAQFGISFSAESIVAAIEKAVADINKGGVNSDAK